MTRPIVGINNQANKILVNVALGGYVALEIVVILYVVKLIMQ